MNLNIARKIDFWAGIPICFLLSIFEGIAQRVRLQKKEKTKIKRILFIEFSEMGSAILAYPAIKEAKHLYPDAEFYFWIFNENKDGIHVLNIMPRENVITVNSKNILILAIDIFKSIFYIRKQKIDIAIDMELFSRFSSILAYLSGAKTRAGFYRYRTEGLYRGDLHTHKVLYNPYHHISRNFIGLVQSLKFTTNDLPLLKQKLDGQQLSLPNVNISNSIKNSLWKRLREIDSGIDSKAKIVAMHIGFRDKLGIRRWPLEYYKELIKKIHDKPNRFIIFVGASQNYNTAPLLNHTRCVDMVAKTSMEELIVILQASNILISHDSGMLHIGSLTDVNIIGLFGPETPVLYEPISSKKIIFYKRFHCSPCLSAYNHRDSICIDNKCMRAITPNEVHKAVEELLI